MRNDHHRTRAAFTWRLLLVLMAVWAGACAAPPAGQDPVLTSRLGEILHSRAECGAVVGARVVELPSRRELYAWNADKPVLPASNMKIPVSAAGLDTFGPDHTFKTYLALDGEDLWIIGTGDPALGDARIARQQGGSTTTVLEEWGRALTGRGITEIPGHLYYYEGALENLQIHPTWEHDDLVHWYAAPVSGLCFNDNCVDVTVSPAADGEPAEVEITPPVQDVVVINRCVSGNPVKPSISRMAHADVLVLGGGCRKRTALKSKPVLEPGAFLADALRTHLLSKGITIQGEIKSAPEPLGGRLPPPAEHLVATHESCMVDVLWRINKSSQNLFAECLAKLSGQAFEAARGRAMPGSWASADRAVRGFLRKYDIDDDGFVLADGSGLSRANRVTARIMTDILAVMFEHPDGEAFRESLAEPGAKGTLGSRMKDLAGLVFVKTGYVRGVRALSGYVHTRQGRWLCFSIIYNDVPHSVQPFNKLQDRACRVLVEWPDGQSTDKRPGESAAVTAPPP